MVLICGCTCPNPVYLDFVDFAVLRFLCWWCLRLRCVYVATRWLGAVYV